MLGLCCCSGFSLAMASEIYSSCGVQASHYRAFSLVTECGLQGMWALVVVHVGSVVAPGLSRTGSVVVAHRLSCPIGIWDLPQAGIEPVSPALPHGFFRVFYIYKILSSANSDSLASSFPIWMSGLEFLKGYPSPLRTQTPVLPEGCSSNISVAVHI